MKLARILPFAVIVCTLASAVVAQRDASQWSPIVYPTQRLPLIFSHGKHLARGATCASCHPTASTSRSAIDNLIPTEAACRSCHQIDRNVQTNCAQCHPGYTPGSVVARVYAPPGPIKFDHSAHAKQSCESCHGDMRNVELATTAQLPTMASCLTCHTQGTQERFCTDCHLAKTGGLMETSFPHGTLVDHGPDFARDHRQQASRADAACGACHERSECQDCHAGVVKPLDFHQGNYLLVHAVEAKRGTPDCSACHRVSTFCVACHERSGLGTRGDTEQTSGSFHPAGWTTLHAGAAKRNISSCASCHREEDCLTCHSAEPFNAMRISPHPPGWRGSARCKALDRGNRRMCLRCHVTDDELGCDWSK